VNKKIVSCWLIIINYHIYPMQDDSNLRCPCKKHVCQGQMCESKSKISPQN